MTNAHANGLIEALGTREYESSVRLFIEVRCNALGVNWAPESAGEVTH